MKTLDRVKEMGWELAVKGKTSAFPVEIFSEKYSEVFAHFYEGYEMGLKMEVGITTDFHKHN